MTAGRDPSMPCAEVVRLVWEFLDDEIDDERRGKIREHLDICPPCRDHFTFEGAFLRAVSRVIDEPGDTASLQRRVLQALRDEGYDGHR